MLGVLLINLGGPESLDDVRPFLYNLLSDPEVMKIPAVVRKPLAAFIAYTRAPKSRGYYAAIGGGSPLRRITEAQAAALAARLEERGHPARAYAAMRCWHPFIGEAVDRMVADGVTELVVLPLFPHFSVSTTGTSVKELYRVFAERGGLRQIRRHYVTRWYDNPRYVDAVARHVEEALAAFPDPASVHLLFSAHSIPVSYVERGDPYQRHTEACVRLVLDRLNVPNEHSLAFQSKLGPVKWLEPSTDSRIRELGARDVKQVLCIPISFVSDHIETLYEIDILYKGVADEVGIEHFRGTRALDCDPLFVDALADLVIEQVGEGQAAPGAETSHDARA